MAKMANALFAQIFTTPIFEYADVTFTIHLLFSTLGAGFRKYRPTVGTSSKFDSHKP